MCVCVCARMRVFHHITVTGFNCKCQVLFHKVIMVAKSLIQIFCYTIHFLRSSSTIILNKVTDKLQPCQRATHVYKVAL